MTTDATQLHFKAAVFDLDGVVTATARLHAEAWKGMFDAYLSERAKQTAEPFRPFDKEEDYLQYVDGKPRYEGVRSFLESRGIQLPYGDPSDEPGAETSCGLGNRKNQVFVSLVRDGGADVFESSVELVRELRKRGVRVAVATSSKNCQLVLESVALQELFEAQVDGVVSAELGLKGKPHPDIFHKAAELIGAQATETILFEDAVSGVQAGSNGNFGLVVGIDRGANWFALRDGGADLIVSDLSELTVEKLDTWFARRADARPSALRHWGEVRARFTGRRPAAFLDYDGTLTPIVARPDLALLSDEGRDALRQLADVVPTLIVSGRGREDVAGMVRLDNLFYAGSHGFDIAGPDGSELRHEVGEAWVGKMDAIHEQLCEQVKQLEGAIVEHKRFSVALHYRQVEQKHVAGMEELVDRIVASDPGLKKTHGKKVFEVRPQLEWDKGKAVLWLMQAVGLEKPDVVPFYIGDDTTDEDAFAALKGRGFGVVVTEVPRPTKAEYSLQNPREVHEFLRRLAGFEREKKR